MNKKLLYRKAYRLLDRSTPLKFDCGLLCGQKCCSGGTHQGMLLFPGEEAVLEGKAPFLHISRRSSGNEPVRFAVCRGTCIRKFRPLACRIFPLAPYISEEGKLRIVEDPRARYLCPLLASEGITPPDLLFRRNVYRAFRLLLTDREIAQSIHRLSGILKEYAVFTGAIL